MKTLSTDQKDWIDRSKVYQRRGQDHDQLLERGPERLRGLSQGRDLETDVVVDTDQRKKEEINLMIETTVRTGTGHDRDQKIAIGTRDTEEVGVGLVIRKDTEMIEIDTEIGTEVNTADSLIVLI